MTADHDPAEEYVRWATLWHRVGFTARGEHRTLCGRLIPASFVVHAYEAPSRVMLCRTCEGFS